MDIGVTNGVSENEFGADIISGRRVATWVLRAIGYDGSESWNNTEQLASGAGILIPYGTSRDDVVGVIYEMLMTTPVGDNATVLERLIIEDEARIKVAVNAGLVSPEWLDYSVEVPLPIVDVTEEIVEVEVEADAENQETEPEAPSF